MQQRQLLRGILIAVALLVVMLAGSGIWLLTRSPIALLLAKPTLPDVVRLVPSSATSMLVFKTQLSQLQQFVQAAIPASQRRRTRQQWNRILSERAPGILGEFWQASHLDFEREVKPWLGQELLLAQWQPDPNSPDLGSLVALATQDLTRSNLFLNLLWQRQELAGIPLIIETYKGIQLVTTPLAELPQLTGAAFGNRYVVLADRPQILRQAIDSWQLASSSLPNQARFQQVIAPLDQPTIGWAYFRQPGSLKTLGVGLGVTFQGLKAQTAAIWDSPEQPAVTSLAPLLDLLPAHISALATGQDLATALHSIQALSPIAGQDPLKPLRTLAKPLPELLDGKGEFALALLDPKGKSSRKSVGTDPWLLITTAEPDWESKAHRLGLEAQKAPLRQPIWGEAIAWIPTKSAGRGAKTPVVYRLQRGSYAYLSSSLASIEQAFSDPPLTGSVRWRHVTQTLPLSQQGFGFVQGKTLFHQAFPGLVSIWKLPLPDLIFSTTEIVKTDQQGLVQKGQLFVGSER